jgi:hypothetical protein
MPGPAGESAADEVARVPGLAVHLKTFAASEESLAALRRAKLVESKRIKEEKDAVKAALGDFIALDGGKCWAIPGIPDATGAAAKTRYLRVKESVSRKAIKSEMVAAAIRRVAASQAAVSQQEMYTPTQFAAAVSAAVEEARTERRDNVVVDTSKQRGVEVRPLLSGDAAKKAMRLSALGDESRAVAKRFTEAAAAPTAVREQHVAPVQDFLQRREGGRDPLRVVMAPRPATPEGAEGAEAAEGAPPAHTEASDGGGGGATSDTESRGPREELTTAATPSSEYFLRVKDSVVSGKITPKDVEDSVVGALARHASVAAVVQCVESLDEVISDACLVLRDVEAARAKTTPVVKLDMAPRKRVRDADADADADDDADADVLGSGEPDAKRACERSDADDADFDE